MTDLNAIIAARTEDMAGVRAIHTQLDKLVTDLDESGDLERLEDGLSQFNIFEALGAANAEVRHSNFLAWLFNPSGSHGLGDIIVRRFLRRVLRNWTEGLSPVAVDLMDLSDLEVRREWGNIDICLISKSNHLVVVIENKINASERANQLRDYRQHVEQQFPQTAERSWKLLLLFLTIDGDPPKNDRSYRAFSHREIVDLLEATIRNRRQSVLPDVATLINHYTRMMRSYHMDESELIKLARDLYTRHRSAFEFIFTHRPDAWSDAKSILLKTLSLEGSIEVDPSTDRSIDIRFLPSAWSPWREYLSQGLGWKTAGSNAFILCKITPDKERNRAQLQLQLGPGPDETRKKLLKALRDAGVYSGTPAPKWTLVFKKEWRMLVKDGETLIADPEAGARRLRQDIEEFTSKEAPQIARELANVFDNHRTPLPGDTI